MVRVVSRILTCLPNGSSPGKYFAAKIPLIDDGVFFRSPKTRPWTGRRLHHPEVIRVDRSAVCTIGFWMYSPSISHETVDTP